jgi:carbon storage regulator
MLVLARKIGEKIILNDDIEVIILDANQNTVRIGVNAPKHVSVYREELYREIKSANNDSRNASANSISVLHELIKVRKNDFRFANFDALTNKVKND